MADLVLRARRPVEILDAAVTLFRRHASQYVMLTAVIVVPFAILQLLVGAPSPRGGDADALGSVLGFVSAFVGYSLSAAAVARFGDAVYAGRTPDAGAALRAALPLLPRVLGATLAQGLLIFIGMFGLLVGGVYMTALTFAVVTVVVLENRGVRDALSRSAALSKDRKRHILATITLGSLVYFGVAVVIGLASFLSDSGVVALVLNTLVQVIAYPILSLTYLVLYYDTRIRGEGYDLEVLQASLAPTPAA